MTSWTVVAFAMILSAAFGWAALRSSGKRRQQRAAGAGAWLGVTIIVVPNALRVENPMLTALGVVTVAICATIVGYYRWYPPSP